VDILRINLKIVFNKTCILTLIFVITLYSKNKEKCDVPAAENSTDAME